MAKYKYSWQTGYKGEQSDPFKMYQDAYNEAKAQNELRYTQGLDILDKAIERYQPGGQFGQGAMAQYETGKYKAMSEGMSSLVSSGLSNTTVAAGMPLKYEQEVGTPFRLQLEDMRMGKLTAAEQAKVKFIQEREDMYPDIASMMQYGAQGASGGTSYGPNSLSDFDTGPDPGVSSRNAAEAAMREAKDKERAAENRRRTMMLAEARRSNQTQYSKPQSESTWSEADYSATLAKNMGWTVDQPDPAQTGPFQPGTAPTGWTGPETNWGQPATTQTKKTTPTATTTGYGTLDDWMDFSY
jgi:hypothetical protein